MLQLFSRQEFEQAVAEHRAERHARGFSCWGQFVAMLFCHLGRAQSLREICGGLAASEGKLRHLGVARCAQALHPGLCQRASALAVVPRRVLSTAGPLPRSFRSAWLPLQEQTAEPGRHPDRTLRQRLRLGAVPAHQGRRDAASAARSSRAAAQFCLVTEGRVHESRVARTLRFDPGAIVVFDRGYTDYAWFSALDADGVYFVTRMKDNADYGVVERRPVPERGPVQRDEIIFLYKLARDGERDLFLRRIEV